jgi:hypothetical protein
MVLNRPGYVPPCGIGRPERLWVLNLSTGGLHATGRLEFVSSTCHQNSNLMVGSLI